MKSVEGKLMKTKKLKFALLFLTFILAVAIMACSADNKTTDTPDGAINTNEVEAPAEPETPQISDNLPEDLDFGGSDFRVLNAPSLSWNTVFFVEEQSGDLIDDAVYLRNAAVESRLNFKIEETLFDDQTVVMNTARKEILADSDSFDMAILIDRHALNLAQQGLVLPYNKLIYIDLSKEYWSQTLNKDMSIGNKLYFSYGDYNLTGYESTVTMLFNKKLLQDLNLEDPYKLVLDGKWTFDKFAEMALAARADLNGDGETDRFGYVTLDKHVLPSFWIAAGVRSVKKDENDLPYFSVPGDEKFGNVYEKIFAVTKGIDSFSGKDPGNDFRQRMSLFTRATFFEIQRYRDMEDDFGIIPHPKYDENQSQYYVRVGGGSLSIVPVTTPEADKISAILEALASESRKTLIPVYYEVGLQSKFSRDERSEEMLDLIFNHRIYDLGDTYWCDQLRDGVFAEMFTKDDMNLTSKMESIKASMDRTIQAAINAFAAIEID